MWAFGISRDGLGLTEATLWSLTPREFSALRQVWLDGIERQNYLHASIQATLYNAHFDSDGTPWTPEDLLGKGNRAERKSKALADKWMALRPDKQMAGEVDDLPDWATRKNAVVN